MPYYVGEFGVAFKKIVSRHTEAFFCFLIHCVLQHSHWTTAEMSANALIGFEICPLYGRILTIEIDRKIPLGNPISSCVEGKFPIVGRGHFYSVYYLLVFSMGHWSCVVSTSRECKLRLATMQRTQLNLSAGIFAQSHNSDPSTSADNAIDVHLRASWRRNNGRIWINGQVVTLYATYDRRLARRLMSYVFIIAHNFTDFAYNLLHIMYILPTELIQLIAIMQYLYELVQFVCCWWCICGRCKTPFTWVRECCDIDEFWW